MEPNRTRDDPWWVRASWIWLIGVTGGLIATGVYASQWFSRPRGAIVAFILVLMGPFAHARVRLMRHLDRDFSLSGGAGTIIAAMAAVFDAVMVAQLVTARTDYSNPLIAGEAVGWIGPVWFSSHALIFLGLVLAGPIRRMRGWLRNRRRAEPVSIARRDFLRGVGKVGVGLPFAVSLSGVETSYDFRVEERDISLAGWPRVLDGLRVAHLSDIHVGGAMDLEKLKRVAELTNGAKADLVLHSGDFLTHRMPGFDEPLYEALAMIHAPYGQWACFGNHDYDDPRRLARRLAGAGVEVLRDRLATIDIKGEPVEVGGLEFAFYGSDRAQRYAAALARWRQRSEMPRIVLCHDPSAFATLPQGCADLVLSGHTHGGHVGIQFDRDALTVVGMLGYPDQGIFERADMKLFVTRCVGFYGYPIRLGIPPEIAVLTLRSAVPATAGLPGNSLRSSVQAEARPRVKR